jgi:hypothetical protein
MPAPFLATVAERPLLGDGAGHDALCVQAHRSMSVSMARDGRVLVVAEVLDALG